MKRRVLLIILIILSLFAINSIYAQGNSCEGLENAQGRGNTSAVAERHECVTDDSGDGGDSGDTDNTDDTTNTNNNSSSNNGNGNGAQPDNPSVNPVRGETGIPEGAGCQGLENALESVPEDAAGHDAVEAQHLAHGCFIDEDFDGVDDRVDNCLNLYNPEQGDVDEDGIGDACDDSDGDGILDISDNCFSIVNPDQADLDSDGIGDVCDDSDDDGIFDNADNCVFVANPDQIDEDEDGIGAACDDDDSMGNGDVQITLHWSTSADLDLYAYDPDDELIYYGNKESASGGIYDIDANANCFTNTSPNNVENIYWPTNGAPSGEYEVFVDLFAVCGSSDMSWTLTVKVDGEVILEETGSGSSTSFSFIVP